MLDRQKLKEEEWTVGELVPMLFDNLTGALFVGGCLLLWLNFRRRGRDILLLTPKETVDRITRKQLTTQDWKRRISKSPHLRSRMKQSLSMRHMQLHLSSLSAPIRET